MKKQIIIYLYININSHFTTLSPKNDVFRQLNWKREDVFITTFIVYESYYDYAVMQLQDRRIQILSAVLGWF